MRHKWNTVVCNVLTLLVEKDTCEFHPGLLTSLVIASFLMSAAFGYPEFSPLFCCVSGIAPPWPFHIHVLSLPLFFSFPSTLSHGAPCCLDTIHGLPTKPVFSP